MRKPRISVLLVITIVFAAFTFGFFLGRTQHGDELSVMLPEKFMTTPALPPENNQNPAEEIKEISFPISINQADKEEIMALPGIGEVLAERIIAYRKEYGNFSSVAELVHVEGIGQKRLNEISDLITVGG